MNGSGSGEKNIRNVRNISNRNKSGRENNLPLPPLLLLWNLRCDFTFFRNILRNQTRFKAMSAFRKVETKAEVAV